MKKDLHLLIVEDSEDDARLLLAHLKNAGYNTVHKRVETAGEMRAALDTASWDAILADYTLPSFMAPDALKILQERDLDLPFIVWSGSIGEENAVALMKAGANDYISKDNMARLVPALERELREAENRRERKLLDEAQREMERHIQQTQKLESLGVLAGGIAHDFNNILTTLLGNATLALDELAPMSPAREYIREIEKASRRAAELCNQMLAYSGRSKFVIETFHLGDMIGEMLHLLKVSISKKALLNLHLEKNLPPMRGDATQIRQIIMNLVINASEAIGDRSGAITISTGAMECSRDYLLGTYLDENLAEGFYVWLEVSDTGCGMDKDTQSRLFEPFFTTKFTGRGLGMAAVLGIARSHKGALKVYSEVGKGTTFKALFPAAEIEAPPQGEGPGEDASEWKGSGTILLVDDEESIRALGKRMLEHLNLRAVTAADGCEALEIYKEKRGEIDLVLLDLTMPRMNGEETFRELRGLDPNVRVLMSSGYAEHEIVSRFSGKGLVGFVQKPYSLNDIKERLRLALGRKEKQD